MLEVLGEPFAELSVDVSHLQGVGAISEVVYQMDIHVFACVYITVSSVGVVAMLDVVFHVLAEPHAGKCGVEADACLTIDDVDDATCLDGVGSRENVPIDDFRILCDFRNEIEVEEFVGTRAVDVGVKVDGEIVVGELFESNSDRLFCLRLCDGFHKRFFLKDTD